MLRIRTALLAGLALAALPLAPRQTAFADDPVPPAEPAMEPAMEAPKEAPKRPESDDANIFKDWKICSARGVKHCRERAEFWTKKGTIGKDLVWLGRMYARGEEYAKAAAAYEQFLEYKVPANAPEKDQGNNTSNRQVARIALIDVYFKAREWQKSADMCEKFRADWPDNAVAIDTWDDEGRAYRMMNDDAKALERFEKGAEKQFRALSDIIDLHLCNGDVEKAQAALTKFGATFDKQPDKLNWLKDMVTAIGTPAPALDSAVAVAGEPVRNYDKVMVLVHWSVQSSAVDQKLAKIEMLRRSNTDKMNAIGIATFKKYNMETRKIEAELTEDQEAAGIRKFWDQAGERITPCAMVPQAFLDALKIKWDNQVTVIDAKGRLRYSRFNEEKGYDLAALEKVILKLAEAPAAPATPATPATPETPTPPK